MSGYYAVYNDEALMHYGVKGMKWGVRRYERKGGSFVRRGMKRMEQKQQAYNDAKSEYKQAKKDYKAKRISKQDLWIAKDKKRAKKIDRDKQQRQLKSDYLADQGKRLYGKGKTVRGNKAVVSNVGAITAAGVVASRVFLKGRSTWVRLSKNTRMNVNLGAVVPATIALGGAAVGGILTAKNNYQNKRLRAYYSHNGG